MILQGDCLHILPTLADSSVDLIVTDPPYFKAKNEAWDRQWNKPTEFLDWLDKVLVEFYRVLKPNGSLYLFASPKMAARVEVLIGERFDVLNRIRWIKENGWHKKNRKEELRSYLSPWEEIIFAQHYGADTHAKGESGYGQKCDELRGFVFEPLRAYIRSEAEKVGFNRKDINRIVGSSLSGGGMASHYVGNTDQWALPTEEHYNKMRAAANNGTLKYFTREYEDLRSEYEDLRRPFNVTAHDQYTDVWEFPTVKSYPGKHPCEKPLAMIEHMIRVSSKPGAVVLDAFAGSGVVGEAAQNLGREFILIEQADKYLPMIESRLNKPQQLELV